MIKSFIIRFVAKFIYGGKEINRDIPIGYLLGFACGKLVELLYGFWYFHRMKAVFVKPSVVVKAKSHFLFGKHLRIGRNVYIDALSKNGIRLGDAVSIGMNTTILCTGSLFSELGKGLIVGNNVGLGTHGFLGCAGGVEIGDDTIFGNFVSIHSENHNFSETELPIRQQGVNRKGVKIGRDCWVGAKVTFLDGARIGDGCIVAAGAVVRGTFPAYSIIGGVPAKIIKSRIQIESSHLIYE